MNEKWLARPQFHFQSILDVNNSKLILQVTGKLKVFPSILALLGPFYSCVLLVKHQRFLESIFADNSIDNSNFVACRVLSKDSRVGLRSVYLAAFEYFRPGIMRFDSANQN